ncbi:MAG: extracellular solute-binding protein [Chloroflexi bacterium]|nr:extracellular solute-binding protein [Chloroflexota bacterium]
MLTYPGTPIRRIRLTDSTEKRPKLLTLLLVLLLMAGCRDNTAPATTPEQPLPNGISSSRPPLEGDKSAPQQPSDGVESLVLWVPPFFSIDSASRADAVLAATLAEFAPSPAGSSVTLIPKAERGPAGMLSYLLTTSQAASKLLPDIVLLNSFDLPRVADAGLLTPLTQEEFALFSGIPLPILQTAQWQGKLYGLPYVANLDHLVYQTDRLPSPPATWDTFLAQDKRLLFAGSSINDHSINFVWMLYLIGGGQIDEDGYLIDPQIAQAALEFLDQSRNQGLIPDSALTLSSPQAVWTFFVNGNAEMAVVPADLFYNQQSEAGKVGFASLPTLDGKARSVVTSWSFVIITQEAERRQRALRLLQQLFAPQIQGEWSRFARQLPTQAAAFGYWDADDPYTRFARDMLLQGVALPNLHTVDAMAPTMQQAQREILAGEKSPQQVLEILPLRP